MKKTKTLTIVKIEMDSSIPVEKPGIVTLPQTSAPSAFPNQIQTLKRPRSPSHEKHEHVKKSKKSKKKTKNKNKNQFIHPINVGAAAGIEKALSLQRKVQVNIGADAKPENRPFDSLWPLRLAPIQPAAVATTALYCSKL